MSDKIKDGGPAFPHRGLNEDGCTDIIKPGMSLRDYFAGQALAGIMANPLYAEIGDEARNAIALDQAEKMLVQREATK